MIKGYLQRLRNPLLLIAMTLAFLAAGQSAMLRDPGTFGHDDRQVDRGRPEARLADARDDADAALDHLHAMLTVTTNTADAASTLTVRDHYWDRPTPVDRARWRFVNGASGPPRLALDGGFLCCFAQSVRNDAL